MHPRQWVFGMILAVRTEKDAHFIESSVIIPSNLMLMCNTLQPLKQKISVLQSSILYARLLSKGKIFGFKLPHLHVENSNPMYLTSGGVS